MSPLLILGFILVLLAFRSLLKPKSKASKAKTTTSAKPSAHQKLVDEAFEHANNADPTASKQNVLVLYATEYGFALEVARTVASKLVERGVDITTGAGSGVASAVTLVPRVVNVLHFPVIDFTRERFVLLVCSTTGDGVPPNEASSFRDALVAKDVVIPPTTRFAVLALGDRAYPHFCRAGAIFDALMPDSAHFLQRTEVDQDDWAVIDDWSDRCLDAIQADLQKTPADVSETDYLVSAIEKYATRLNQSVAQYTLKNPFKATLASSRHLTSAKLRPEDKEVVRFEFDISSSGITYQVGDALAIIPRNNPQHVVRLLLTLAANGDEKVRIADGANTITMRFEDALNDVLDVASVRPGLVQFLARYSADAKEVMLAKDILGFDPRDPKNRGKTGLTDFGKSYLAEREVFEVLSDFVSATLSPQQVVDSLRPLHARYYSISSTPTTSPDRIAITVDVLRYTSSTSIQREGVASTFLADRCRRTETKVAVFPLRNPNFRLPNDGTRPIVMIGPGTGVAPFVGFLDERKELGATGENWLFFGCRFEHQDFLYGTELRHHADEGFLRLFTAFSRDGPRKIYVQERIQENAAELWQLVDRKAAHVYVCGDGAHMAGDVHTVLKVIIAQHGAMSEQDAEGYLQRMAEEKRYERDVWVA